MRENLIKGLLKAVKGTSPIQTQMFTIGSSAGVYVMSSITFRDVTRRNNSISAV